MTSATGDGSRDAAVAKKYVVARTSDIPVGERLMVEVAGREIGIFEVDGTYVAVRNVCPHLAGPLCEGEIVNLVESEGPGNLRLDTSKKMLVCPWHGWEFDLRTGESYWDPHRVRAVHFSVGVEQGSTIAAGLPDGTQRIRGPYSADLIPVTVEDDYLVVSLLPLRPSVATDKKR